MLLAGTTRGRTRSCGHGSTRAGSASTTWTGCAGRRGSSAPLRERRRVAAGGLAVEVRRLRPQGVRDGGHDLRQDPSSADGVVRYGLADGWGCLLYTSD